MSPKPRPLMGACTKPKGRSGISGTGTRSAFPRGCAMWTPSRRGPRVAIGAGCKAIAWSCKAWSFPLPCRSLPAGAPTRWGKARCWKRRWPLSNFPVTELLLGDSTFGGADLVALYAQHGGWLLTPQQLPTNPESWQHDLYAYRRETIELLFQRIIQACDLKACPTKGLARTGTFVIASVWLYQVLFLDNHRHQRPARSHQGDHR